MTCGTVSRLPADPTPPPNGVATTPVPAGSSPSKPAKKIVPVADSDDDDQPEVSSTPTAQRPAVRTLFGLLDSRSSYGRDFFPDPFLGPEFDRETQLELDYVRGQKGHQQSNEADAGFEWNFLGQFTVSGEFGYDSEHEQPERGISGAQDTTGENARGFEGVDLAVYHPVFEFVGKDGGFDYTAVGRLDVGIPTRTAVSGNDFKLTPYLGQLLRVGGHVSLEAWTGPQFTLASHQTNQLIYGAALGYEIARSQVALPVTKTVTPLLELDAQTPFSGRGRDALFGVAGFNWQFLSVVGLHPRLNVGYQFPLDHGARDELHWGIITQLFFDL